ncbi:uncharacterized protein [Epargyreus clarus]|uniref:uncharacterized protein n=1 Tax=Epargyreus clarus TaxID=520877 RepID=UPI003C2AAFB0
MIKVLLILYVLWTVNEAQDYYYQPQNVTRSTLSGLAAYRSALTLDWLAAEDSRQRELASAFETDAPPARFISNDCVTYPKPAPGKIGRLMLELLKNLEGDDGLIIPDLIQVLVRTKILMETSFLEVEPDFEALVKTPGMMMGEPHSTFPRIVAVVWMLVTDPATTRKYGWCPIKQVNKYLHTAKPRDIARHMKALDVIVARARFVMEEFIQNITPINMYQRRPKMKNTPKRDVPVRERQRKVEKPGPPYHVEPLHQLAVMPSSLAPTVETVTPRTIDGSVIVYNRAATHTYKMFLTCVLLVL